MHGWVRAGMLQLSTCCTKRAFWVLLHACQRFHGAGEMVMCRTASLAQQGEGWLAITWPACVCLCADVGEGMEVWSLVCLSCILVSLRLCCLPGQQLCFYCSWEANL